MNTPLYIFGEGYAAKFATAIGAKFLSEKQRGGPITGLKGVGLGGGMGNPIKVLM
jgi:carboxypeptidase C (cathepsin A)